MMSAGGKGPPRGTLGPPMKRRKSGKAQEEEGNICIVHVQGLQYGNIKLLSTVNNAVQRLERLHNVCAMQMAQPLGSSYRMEETCALIPDVLEPHHGYHQECYHRLTMNLSRLTEAQTFPEPCSSQSHRRVPCHTVMLECLECLVLEQYMADRDCIHIFNDLQANSQRKLDNLVLAQGPESLKEASSDEALKKCIEGYLKYHDEVRQGEHGKTPQLWISYMDHIWLVLSLLEAVKQNDFFLYDHTLQLLADLFFSFGGQNYARYLTYFSTFMANIEITHPGSTELIKLGAMSVARSFIPGNRCTVDKTMEETFMQHAKSHSGTSGLLTNYSAYQRWVRSTHARSLYVNAALSMANILSDGRTDAKHRDTRPVEIQRSEDNVKKSTAGCDKFHQPF